MNCVFRVLEILENICFYFYFNNVDLEKLKKFKVIGKIV